MTDDAPDTAAGETEIPQLPRLWQEASCPAEETQLLADLFDLPTPIAGLLTRRGFLSQEEAQTFLEPRLERLSDPLLLPDMARAADRIWTALDKGEHILVFGDYDVDGVTSTAFLSRILEHLGGRVSRFLPNRKDDGYGLSPESVGVCLAQFSPDLIVTVDCGTGSVEAVEVARAAGVEVIVTDHHEASGEVARALAVVNPKLGNHPPAKVLAGVGVAFKLCHALIKTGRQLGRPLSFTADMRPLMYLVALGTVADMVPLTGENRILVRYGIEILNQTPDPGIQALARHAGIRQEMTSYHIGFVLGPRINAAGRMDSPDTALRLLLSDNPRETDQLARTLEKSNRERQVIEEQIRVETHAHLKGQVDPALPGVLVVASRGWHAGVIGIVASRLVRRFHRPAIVISVADNGVGRGSCRSIEGFDLLQHLQTVEDLLLQYGGHRMAAGLDIREEDIDRFRERLNQSALATLAGADLRPRLLLDGWLETADLHRGFVDAQDRLMPFGHDNPVPVWGLRGVKIGRVHRVGAEKQHLRLVFPGPEGPLDAIGFGMGDLNLPEGPLDLAFQLRCNAFRGEERLQLMLQDLRAAQA